MGSARKLPVILMADDDADDRMLTRDAFAESGLLCDLRFVKDGVELFDYLARQGPFAAPGAAPQPCLILLDLNMPRMDGREALARIRADESLRQVPVVVLTTSKAQEDVMASYAAGGNTFITKPVTYAGLVEAVRCFGQYWFDVAQLPAAPPAAGAPVADRH